MALSNIMKGLKYFGVQGAMDQMASETFMGAMKGVTGFVGGAFRGIAGMDQSVKNIGTIGNAARKLGYGTGKVLGAPFHFAMNRPKGTAGGNSWFDNLGEKLNAYTKDIGRAGGKILNATTTSTSSDLADMGAGLFGRRVKSGLAWGISAGALAYGASKGAEDHSMNLGLRTAVNGMMDDQGAAVAPGSVTNTYTPLHVGSGGVEGLGFALHNARNSGYL